MNDTKLNFNGIVTLNTERPSFGNEPLLSQVHKTYENGIIALWATMSVCYHLWTRKNEKRHSSIMMGKLREGNKFILQINGSLSSLLNMALVCISFSQLGIHLVSKSIHFHESCYSFDTFKECIITLCPSIYLVKSLLPSLWSCRLMFRGKSCWELASTIKTNFTLATFESVFIHKF